MATKKPTGLSISRKDNAITCKWKRGTSYNKGQQFGYRVNAEKYTNKDLGSSATSKAFNLTYSKYYPTTQKILDSISFRVRGKKGGSWSAYESKTMTMQITNKPKLTATPDSSITNRCVFAWETETSDSDAKIFIDCEYQTMLVPNCNVIDGSQLVWDETADGWQTGIGTANDSITVDESISVSTGTHTRWFRVRSRGPKGACDWVYEKRVYAAPYQMVIEEATATKTDNGYQAYVKWSGTSNTAYPIDTLTIDYTMATPDAGMVCPSGATPTTAATVAQMGETNAVSFAIDSSLGTDQALYARVNSVHNLTTTYGDWTLVSVGALSQPTNIGVTTDPATYRATVTATNNSSVSDSFLAIIYRTASAPNDFAIVGVIPHGSSSATVQCPNWTGETIQFGVYAVVGSYTATTRADGVGSYEITEIMESAILWQAGTMPDAPDSIAVTATDVQGSVKVTWNWSWEDANAAVISWADHVDAWESTDEPSEYTVSNVHASEWTIAGLETGKRWYVRVRLINSTGDVVIYGPWSELAVIDLSSAPSIPTLTLSSGIIPVGGSVSAYWSYVSTDGTAQAFAEVCEATVSGGGVTYGDIIAQTETAQHVTIYADDVGWNQDETHYLCVRVVSGSGRVSDAWSDPVPVTIAAPLDCDISDTSLETQIIETNPRTFSGNPINFETEIEEQFAELKVELEPIQDLHGYDKPWVGGGGKNILPPRESYSGNGITVTWNDDGSITFDGTSTAEVTLTIPFTLPANTTVTFSGHNSTAISNGARFRLIGGDSKQVYLSGPNVVATWTPTADVTSARFQISSGVTIQGTLYPQLELGSTATDYAPYSNICPISGHTEVSVSVVGKNLLKNTVSSSSTAGVTYTVNDDKTILLSGTATSNAFIVLSDPYRLSSGNYTMKKSGNASITINLRENNSAGSNVISASSTDKTATITSGTYVGVIRIANGTNVNGITLYPQLELNSTSTDYEAYQGQTITATLPQTVYGGTLDLVSGLLTVTQIFVNANTKTWSNTTISGNAGVYAIFSDKLRDTSAIRLCNCLDITTYSSSDRIGLYTSNNSKTSAEIQSLIANGDVQIVYTIADPLTYQLTPQQIRTLVGTNNVWSDSDMEVRIAESVREVATLTQMPITVTVIGAGTGGNTTLIIERAEDYHIDRPNDTDFNGYEGETIYVGTQTGEAEITIDRDDLIGSLDDGAAYRLIATVEDGLGQADTETLDFEVAWEHQAIVPTGTVTIQDTVALITPTKPVGWLDGDTCDIYRLSADRPELIVQGGEFGTTYVDPYPTIRQYGGHRLVYRTYDGDYITPANDIAWTDYGEADGDILDVDYSIINFSGEEIHLRLNLDVSNTWEKDFKETKYLGGSVQGDWNKGYSRKGSVKGLVVTTKNPETITQLKQLAVYDGICHMRTPDGSSYACNINVSDEMSHASAGKAYSVTLNVTRVDSEELDGQELAVWEYEES